MLGYLPAGYNKAVSDIDTNSGAPNHPDSWLWKVNIEYVLSHIL